MERRRGATPANEADDHIPDIVHEYHKRIKLILICNRLLVESSLSMYTSSNYLFYHLTLQVKWILIITRLHSCYLFYTCEI